MASSAASLLRLCLRPSRQLPGLRAAAAATQHTAATRQATLHRTFSASTAQWKRRDASEDGDKDKEQEGEGEDIEKEPPHRNPGEYLNAVLQDESISPKEREAAQRALDNWQNLPTTEKRGFERLLSELDEDGSMLRRAVVPKKDSFWNDEEADPDLITDELGEDDFEEDDIMAMGHAKLEEHREMREYARLAVWEMPLLSSKPRQSFP